MDLWDTLLSLLLLPFQSWYSRVPLTLLSAVGVYWFWQSEVTWERLAESTSNPMEVTVRLLAVLAATITPLYWAVPIVSDLVWACAYAELGGVAGAIITFFGVLEIIGATLLPIVGTIFLLRFAWRKFRRIDVME